MAAECGWCGRQRTPLVWGGYVCPYGCAEAGHAPFRGHCEDCGAEYWTGNPERRDECERCHERAMRHLRAEYDAPGQSHTGYLHRMRMDGVSRRVMKGLKK